MFSMEELTVFEDRFGNLKKYFVGPQKVLYFLVILVHEIDHN